MPAKILIVDDEELIRWSLSRDLDGSGYKTRTASDLREAFDIIDKDCPDAVITDLRLAQSSGLDLLKRMRREHPEVPVVLMTAFADVPSAIEALREGAADYIPKPLQLSGLKITLERVIETAALKRRMDDYRERHARRFNFPAIVARSEAMRKAVSLARRIADSPHGTVLLIGESGAGKDMFARTIHFAGPRADRPFMEINCAAIPERLLESELFGHEKGAFTDADRRKKGLLELADGGTVLFNELGHMPASLQPKLLRALEDRTFRRVGGREDLAVDVRVVAAANEDIERAAAEGRFRRDLYYRINVLSIRIPPLRERPEDIPPLVEKLLDRLCGHLGRPRPAIPGPVLEAFARHSWPGNVRELRNALERMLILGESEFLPPAPADAPRPREPAPLDLPDGGIRLDEVERRLVLQALERTGGNQQRAAQLLGLSRDALRRRMEKFEPAK